MLEREFQAKLIIELKDIFPKCLVLKNDSSYMTGIPDLTILHNSGKWALLECKKSKEGTIRPNQDYYIGRAHTMSFGSFIYPENKQEVLDELKEFFEN